MSDTSARNPVVLIVGAGAIGSFYGAVLAQQGAGVSVVCRSEYEVVRADGFQFQSSLLGAHVFRPAQVLRSATDYQGRPPDCLILSVKVTEGTDRAALIRGGLGPHTAIMLIENGIEIEQEIADSYPEHELISALAYIGVSRVAPGKVHHHAYGGLTLGNYPRGVSDRVRQLTQLWERGGVKCTVTEDVVTARWHKCVWNTVFNPISVLGGGVDTQAILASPDGEDLVRQAMQEVCCIAAATGHSLPDNVIEQYIEGTRKMPAYKTSMALDFENGRPMEVEAILGHAVRAGRREGVAIPKLEALYALIEFVEIGQRARQQARKDD